MGRVTGGEGWKRPTAAGRAKQQGFGGETLKASVPGQGRGGKGITASPRRQWRGADLSLTKSPQRETLGRAPKAGAGREGGMRPPHGRSVSGPGAAAGPSRVPGPTSLTRASLPRVGLIGRAPPATTHARSRSPRSRNAEPKRPRSRSGSMTGCWRQTAPRRPPPPWSGPGAGGGSGTAPPLLPHPAPLRAPLAEPWGWVTRPREGGPAADTPGGLAVCPREASPGGVGASRFPTFWEKGWLPPRPPRERHPFVPCCPPEWRHSCSLANFTTKNQGDTKDTKHACCRWHKLPVGNFTHGIILLPYRWCSSQYFCPPSFLLGSGAGCTASPVVGSLSSFSFTCHKMSIKYGQQWIGLACPPVTPPSFSPVEAFSLLDGMGPF